MKDEGGKRPLRRPCADIGELDDKIQEIKESVGLPLTHPEYYEEMGRKPPKGVICNDPPDTGKTLLTKAVANQILATFLRAVGFELTQKHLGSGPNSCRNCLKNTYYASCLLMKLMLLGQKRYASNSGGEREIQ